VKIVIVSDAWSPQINGVVISLTRTIERLGRFGHAVQVIEPGQFRSVPCPTYPEIRLALLPGRKVRRLLDQAAPDAVHIATEGPLGLAARRWCVKHGFPFTTSYHTRFPEYVWLRARLPLSLSYALVRWFHGGARFIMVATETLRRELSAKGFRNLVLWSRGVDTQVFRPRDRSFLYDPRPIFLYVGRVAIEKNIEAFLKLDLSGTKFLVGDGPDLEALRAKYPQARFVGLKTGVDLARHFAAADVFVFPSRTDTFGLVLIEALACGLPVAAYPVPGPIDIVRPGETGFLSEDLRQASLDALTLDRETCRAAALGYTWEACTRQFLEYIEAARPIAAAVITVPN
jgi:1,2-diacylglycerol 3-alpha-glucosyltransferase/glucuronosyltransferase